MKNIIVGLSATGRAIAVASIVLLSASARAQDASPAITAPPIAVAGNMPPDFYPRPACEKPGATPKSPGNGDAGAMMAYNTRVQLFNKKAAAFNACIKAYVDNAQKDIGQIQDIVHAAVAEANNR